MPTRSARTLLALCCAVMLAPGAAVTLAQQGTPAPAPSQPPQATAAPTGAAEPAEPKISPDQLDSLVAPIALYPDPLLAQTLVASTYPLEIVQLQQWLAKNPNLKDQALVDAVAKQPWDPSIQSMAAVPDVVKRLADDIQWTTELGNAFLAQQSDVMDAVQRMRKKASDNGALKSNEQMVVETKVVEQKTVIVVEPADPEIIYVPSYSPTVVYGAAPYYPYPPIYYPPYYPGGALLGFGVGLAWGAAWGGSCCGCGWGGGDVDINVDNNFNRNTNIDRGNSGRGDAGRGGSGNKWSHNPQHRGGAPYSNKATASKYGGQARGSGQRSPGATTADRGGAGATGSRGGSPSTADRSAGGAGSRGSSPSTADRSAGGAGSRDSSASAANRSGSSASRGSSANQVGSRNVPSSTRSSSSGYSGGSRGYSGSSARASSSRGSASMGSRGGGSRGGGSRGGGGRR